MTTTQDWVTRYEGTTHYHDAMAILIAMHRLITQKRTTVAAANYRVKITLLVMSALTTGALWIYLGGAIPEVTKWIGAVFSTIVSGLTIFQLTIGPERHLQQLDDLYSEFGRSLAHAREHPANFSWHGFKHLEASYIRAGLAEPSREQISDARFNGML